MSPSSAGRAPASRPSWRRSRAAPARSAGWRRRLGRVRCGARPLAPGCARSAGAAACATLERNLDPHGEYSASAPTLRGGLEGFVRAPRRERTEIGAGGVRVSAGQLQLIVLARLLLHRHSTRLVLLDEPAAQMEHAASARLQASSTRASAMRASSPSPTGCSSPTSSAASSSSPTARASRTAPPPPAGARGLAGPPAAPRSRAVAGARPSDAGLDARPQRRPRPLASATCPRRRCPRPAAEAGDEGTDSPPLTPRSAPISAAAAAASAPGGRRGWKNSPLSPAFSWLLRGAPELSAAAGGAVGGLVSRRRARSWRRPPSRPAAPIVGEPAQPASMMGRRLRRAGSNSSFSTRGCPGAF